MANDESKRDAVIREVISIFIDVVGHLSEDEKKRVNENTHIIEGFNIDGDDATEVGMELEKHFAVKPSLEEWGKVARMHEIADLIIKHLDKNNSDE